jgi:hypothetical protein
MKNIKTEEPGPVAPLKLLHHCSCYMFTLLLTMCCYNYLVLEVPLACADVGHDSVSLNDCTVSTAHTKYWLLQRKWRSWVCHTLFLVVLVWKLETVTGVVSRILFVCRQQCHLLACGLFCGHYGFRFCLQ